MQYIKLTRRQKQYLSKHKLVPDEWLLVEEQHAFMKIIHKETKKVKVITKVKGDQK